MFVLIVLAVLGILIVLTVQITKRQDAARRAAKPPVTVEEFDRLRAKLDEAALPMVKLMPAERDTAPNESRLGGGPWAPSSDTRWPVNAKGEPLPFLGQLNFAGIRLPGFPEQGLLQVFENESRAPGEQDPGGGLWWRPHLVWHEVAEGGVTLSVPADLLRPKLSYFRTEWARVKGLAVDFEPALAPGNPYNWPFCEDDVEGDVMDRNPLDEAAAARQKGWEDEMDAIRDGYGVHWVGGYPSFVQGDIWEWDPDPEMRDHDRVLLHIGSDDFVQIGDAGEINVMIRQDDLAARRFERAIIASDCA